MEELSVVLKKNWVVAESGLEVRAMPMVPMELGCGGGGFVNDGSVEF